MDPLEKIFEGMPEMSWWERILIIIIVIFAILILSGNFNKIIELFTPK